MPWGMVKLGPDTTNLERIWGTAGYHYSDFELKGFSHTRLVGSGVFEGGILRVMPSNSRLAYAALCRSNALLDHGDETAIPGLYKATLGGKTAKGIVAELTATTRVGLHRYTFSETNSPYLYVDLASHLGINGRVDDLSLTIGGGNTSISGTLTLQDDFSARYGGLKTHFSLQFSEAFSDYRFVTTQGETASLPSAVASRSRAAFLELRFGSPGPLELRTALSYVGQSEANATFLSEAPFTKSFDTARQELQDAWENILDRVAIENGTDSDLKTFYTALYNAFRMPSNMGDYNALKNETYTGFDGTTHTTAGHAYYSDFSLWDTYRTVHPLYNLIARDEQLEMLQSLRLMAEQSGRFPRWAAGGGHADSMHGFPAAMVLAESHQKGLTGFGASTSYALLKQQATAGSGLSGVECLSEYAQYGYCPSEAQSGSVSRTLDYANSDVAIAELATQLGQTSDATSFSTRAKNYRNLWNQEAQAFLPKSRAGNFLSGCRLEQLSYVGTLPCSGHFIEGSALQYRWGALSDIEALADLFVSPLGPLETFFQHAPQSVGVIIPNGYYWHGNEPGLQSVLLFNELGRPDRTQYWVNWIRRTKYANNSIGLDGNDDGGTLSAWYVLSGFGFLPVAGTVNYEIVSPMFDRVTLDMDGNTLEIVAEGASNGARYVTGARLNGTRLSTPRFTHAEIASGGQLILETASTPGSWQP